MRMLRRKTRRRLGREYEEAAAGFALWIPLTVAGILAVFGAVWLVIWLVTGSSKAAGDASVTRQRNSGGNQVAQNTKLLGDQATVLSDQQKIKVMAANVVTEQDRMDLQGLELNCQSDVAAYNADVQNVLAAGLLPAGLPSSYPDAVCTASTD